MDEIQAMKERTAPLNNDQDNKEEKEELEDLTEWCDETGVPRDAFFVRPDVIDMIADEAKKVKAVVVMKSIKNAI